MKFVVLIFSQSFLPITTPFPLHNFSIVSLQFMYHSTIVFTYIYGSMSLSLSSASSKLVFSQCDEFTPYTSESSPQGHLSLDCPLFNLKYSHSIDLILAVEQMLQCLWIFFFFFPFFGHIWIGFFSKCLPHAIGLFFFSQVLI